MELKVNKSGEKVAMPSQVAAERHTRSSVGWTPHPPRGARHGTPVLKPHVPAPRILEHSNPWMDTSAASCRSTRHDARTLGV